MLKSQKKEDLQPLNSVGKRIQSYYGVNKNPGDLKDIRDFVKARKIVETKHKSPIDKHSSETPTESEFEQEIDYKLPQHVPGLEYTNSGQQLQETESIQISTVNNNSKIIDKYQSKLSELNSRLQANIHIPDELNNKVASNKLHFNYGTSHVNNLPPSSTERLMESRTNLNEQDPISTTRSKSKYRIEIEKLQQRIDQFEKEKIQVQGSDQMIDYYLTDNETHQPMKNKHDPLNQYEYTTTEFNTERSGRFNPGYGDEGNTSRSEIQFSAFVPTDEMKSKGFKLIQTI